MAQSYTFQMLRPLGANVFNVSRQYLSLFRGSEGHSWQRGPNPPIL